MNLWACGESGCKRTVLGLGGAIGLRAIGWQFSVGPFIRCPEHRTDGETQQRFMGCERPIGEPCPMCRGEMEAYAHQTAMGSDFTLEQYTNKALGFGVGADGDDAAEAPG